MPPQATRGIAELFDAARWSEWFAELDRGFIFLLLLPFVVALVGLWAWLTESDDEARRKKEHEMKHGKK